MKIGILFVVLSLGLSIAARAQFVDGSSQELAAYSASQLLIQAGQTAAGTYWFDEDQGLGTPFETYVDMSTDGGGWTLAVYSGDSSSVGFDISSNVGALHPPFSGFSYTRDVEYLAEDQDAEIRYQIHDTDLNAVFDGYYLGRFSDIDPVFTTTISGTPIAGVDASYDFHGANDYNVMVWVREQDVQPALRAVPEPATYAAIFGMLSLVVVSIRRRR